jgi:hypothetical protein
MMMLALDISPVTDLTVLGLIASLAIGIVALASSAIRAWKRRNKSQ